MNEESIAGKNNSTMPQFSLSQFSLSGKIALVTGSSRGLGQAMAVALAEAGADIVGASTGPDQPETRSLVLDAGRKFHAIELDVGSASSDSISRLADRLVRDGIRIDVLVNNAGIIRRSPAVDYSDQDWQDVIDVNLTGAFRLCREFGRRMIEARSGKIINIASLLSFSGGITVPAYSASKGGIMQLTKALANEWAASNVQVNAIAPGYFVTDNTAALRVDSKRDSEIRARIPAGEWGQPSQLMGAIVFLASSASDYVNGHTLVVDGGFMAR